MLFRSLRFLRERGHRGTFIGYDVAPGMIETARGLHGEGADRQWRIVNAVLGVLLALSVVPLWL